MSMFIQCLCYVATCDALIYRPRSPTDCLTEVNETSVLWMLSAPSGSNRNRTTTTTRDCIIIFKTYYSVFSSKLKHISIATNKPQNQKGRKGRVFLFSNTKDIPNKDNSSKRAISCVTCKELPVTVVILNYFHVHTK
jgi:hypothetical protein